MLTKKFCQNCGSEDVQMIAGGITGSWMCKNCGQTGNFPERPIVGSEERSDKVMEDIKLFMKGKGIKKKKGEKK